ncbi:MAG TPA: CHAP domain-containing protein [Solirubrobacteraceae bacterium]|jgi:hypothetical protein
MSIETTLDRVSAIRQALSDPATMIGGRTALTGGTEAPSTAGEQTTSFASALAQASSGYPQPEGSQAGAPSLSPAEVPTSPYASYVLQEQGGGYPSAGMGGVIGAGSPTSGATSANQIVANAESQIGQSEQPPGSNESPAIAQYRSATAGAAPGEPWCAYFASWAARQAGEPIGTQGEGLGSVSEIWSWAQSTGRAVANGPGVVPKPGDLIVFGSEHVGIVKEVLPSGQIATIEGNYENKVAQNVRSPTEATGYVSMS